MGELTIITALIDIGRQNWEGYQRPATRYLDYFKFWARMQNQLVVYTDSAMAEQVRQIRGEFGLEKQTKVIVMEDITVFDPVIYQGIERVLGNKVAVDFRTEPDHPECYIPLYVFLTYAKAFFVCDAVERKLTGENIAWLDFGYNHGGAYYTKAEEFDFLWKFDVVDKMHLFAIRELDDLPVFEIVRTLETYILAGLMMGAPTSWMLLRESFRRSIEHLLACGLADDEQTLLVMAYREDPERFVIHNVDHSFQPLQLAGGAHLSSKTYKKYKSAKNEAKFLWRRKRYRDAVRQYRDYLLGKLRGI